MCELFVGASALSNHRSPLCVWSRKTGQNVQRTHSWLTLSCTVSRFLITILFWKSKVTFKSSFFCCCDIKTGKYVVKFKLVSIKGKTLGSLVPLFLHPSVWICVREPDVDLSFWYLLFPHPALISVSTERGWKRNPRWKEKPGGVKGGVYWWVLFVSYRILTVLSAEPLL